MLNVAKTKKSNRYCAVLQSTVQITTEIDQISVSSDSHAILNGTLLLYCIRKCL